MYLYSNILTPYSLKLTKVIKIVVLFILRDNLKRVSLSNVDFNGIDHKYCRLFMNVFTIEYLKKRAVAEGHEAGNKIKLRNFHGL
jgi:hypothetical protein